MGSPRSDPHISRPCVAGARWPARSAALRRSRASRRPGLGRHASQAGAQDQPSPGEVSNSADPVRRLRRLSQPVFAWAVCQSSSNSASSRSSSSASSRSSARHLLFQVVVLELFFEVVVEVVVEIVFVEVIGHLERLDDRHRLDIAPIPRRPSSSSIDARPAAARPSGAYRSSWVQTRDPREIGIENGRSRVSFGSLPLVRHSIDTGSDRSNRQAVPVCQGNRVHARALTETAPGISARERQYDVRQPVRR